MRIGRPSEDHEPAGKASLLLSLLYVVCTLAPACGQETSSDAIAPSPGSPAAAKHYRDAANLQNNVEFAAAQQEWESFLAEYPDDPMVPHAQHYLGICLMQQDKLAEAAKQFQLAAQIETFKSREESSMNWGWCIYSLGVRGEQSRFEEAIDIFRTMLKEFPDGTFVDQTLFYMGECLYLSGQPEQAAKVYRRLVDDYPESKQRPDALYALVVAAGEANNPADVVAAAESFFANYPDHDLAPEIALRQGEALFQNGQFEKAQLAFQRANEAEKYELADHASMRIGACLESLQQFSTAATHYAAFSDSFPTSEYLPGAALGAARNLYHASQWDEALSWFDKARALNPKWTAETAHWAARIYLQTERPNKAVNTARAALVDLPDDDAWRTKLSLDFADGLYAQPQQRSKAIEAYLRIAETFKTTPEAGQALYNAAYAALESDQHEQVSELTGRFLQQFPTHERIGDIRHVQAESALAAQRFEEATRAFEELIRDYPDHTDVDRWRTRLGTALQAMGKHDAAIELLAGSAGTMKSNEFQAEAIYRAAASRIEQGDLESAISSLQTALREHPDNPMADRMLLLEATAAKKNGQLQQAKTLLTTLLDRYASGNVADDATFQLAELAYAEGDLAGAKSRYEELLTKWPASELNPLSFYGKAWINLREGNTADAIESFSRVIDQHADHSICPRCLQGRALARQRQKDFAKGLRDCEAFLNTNPQGNQLADGWYIKALCEIGLKQTEDAIASLTYLDQNHSDYPRRDYALYELAWQVKQNDAEAAVDVFRRLAEDYPQSRFRAEALVHLGEAEIAAADDAAAEKLYRDAVVAADQTEHGETARYKLGYLLLRQKKYAEARDILLEQLQQYPTGKLAAEGSFLLAECWFALQEYAQAAGRFERLANVKLQSRWSQELMHLHAGQAEIQRERFSDALKWLTPLYQMEPPSQLKWKARFEMAQSLRRMQRPDEALQAYADVADHDRDETGARARFMLGELLFGQQQLAAALTEFQKLVYGYGGSQASPATKKWQVKGALEAGRTASALASGNSSQQTKFWEKARKYFAFVTEHAPDSDDGRAAQEYLEKLPGRKRVSQRTGS